MKVIKYSDDLHPYFVHKESVFGRIFGHKIKIYTKLDESHVNKFEKYMKNYHPKFGMTTYYGPTIYIKINEDTKLKIGKKEVTISSKNRHVFNSILNYFVNVLPRKESYYQ